MGTFAALVGGFIILAVLWDAFEAIILPRRVRRRFQFSRFFYGYCWRFWSAVMRRIRSPRRRDTYLSYFGPLSLPLLLLTWAIFLILGFALVYMPLAPLQLGAGGFVDGFAWDLYFSATTLFGLGMGDVEPSTPLLRFITASQAAVGLAFLTLIIGYIPIVYQAFAKREVDVVLLDARAGEPPTALEFLRRQAMSGNFESGTLEFLKTWEKWGSNSIESHISYPLLSYYRSQHDNQSWLQALTMVLDTSAFIHAAFEPPLSHQALLTFAMGRHMVVDISQVFNIRPHGPTEPRLTIEGLTEICTRLEAAGLHPKSVTRIQEKLWELRRMYEPYVCAMSEYLLFGLPPWMPARVKKENWVTSVWEHNPE